ncbi:hypothetical protein PG995_006200 [Apiospora arundinis]
MADWLDSKLKPESRYHSIPGSDTLTHDRGKAHVIFHMKDVGMGPGFGDRLRKGLDDFLKALEANPKDHVIGLDHVPTIPKAIYGNAPAGALLGDFDDLIKAIKVGKTQLLHVDTLKKDIGETGFGTAGLPEMRQYVQRAVGYVHDVRARNWLSLARTDPVWNWSKRLSLRDGMEEWNKGIATRIHELNMAYDCLAAQGRSTGEVGGLGDQAQTYYHDCFKAVYRMSPQEATELVRHAALRGEDHASLPGYRKAMHLHVNKWDAYVNWRSYFVAHGRRQSRLRDQGQGSSWNPEDRHALDKKYWTVLQHIAPYSDAYIEVVYAMAKSLQRAPDDLVNFYRLHDAANQREAELVRVLGQIAFTNDLAEKNPNFAPEFYKARYYVQQHDQWAGNAERSKPFDVFRSMLPTEHHRLPGARTMPVALFVEETRLYNQSTVKADLLQGINLDIDGALAPTLPVPPAPWGQPARPAPPAPWGQPARPLNTPTSFANVAKTSSVAPAPAPRGMMALGRGRGRGGGPQPQQGGMSRKRKTVSLWDQEDQDGLFSETSDEDQEDTVANRVIKRYRPLWMRNGSQRQENVAAGADSDWPEETDIKGGDF